MNKLANINDKRDIITFTDEQISLIKDQIAVGASDGELQLFLYQAKKTGLDPLARQIYFIKRNVWNKDSKSFDSKMTIQTSIDGFRLIAERSNKYSGQDEPKFIEGSKYPKSCTVTVYKIDPQGNRVGISATAFWEEYVQTDKSGNPTTTWIKMPHTMLSKVAEALALRKAFPQDLSGIYTNDEMLQADMPVLTERKIEIRRLSENTLNQLELEIKQGAYDSVVVLERLEKAEKKLIDYPDLLDRVKELHEQVVNDLKEVETVTSEEFEEFEKA